MDAKFSAQFWTDRNVVELDKDAKLAAAWMITNSAVNLAGYAEISMKVFSFETEVDAKALDRAFEGLQKGFVRAGRGYWMRNFIRDQIGTGDALVRNLMCRPLLRDLRAMPEDVVALVLAQYPELAPCLKVEALPKGSESPTQGHAKGQSRAEQSRAERSRAEQSGAQGGAGGKRAPKVKAGYVLPSALGDPLASRLISIGLLKGRQASTPWAPAEIEAVRAACLDTLSDEDFQAQMGPMRKLYLAVIPREKDFRRRDLGTLLNNWSGELDRARAYARENDDGIVRY